MLKRLAYEIAAMTLAMVGAFILISALMPLINPGHMEVATHGAHFTLVYYLVATPIPLAILVAAWRLNCKAQALRRTAEKSSPASQTKQGETTSP